MLMRLILSTAALALLVGCSGASDKTAAPKTDAEKAAVANEIATLMSDPKMVDQMFDGMGQQAMQVMPQMCAQEPADQIAACQARMSSAEPIIKQVMAETMDEAKTMMPDLMQQLGAIMAREYTGEELAVMKDFYGSPEGKSIVQKQPAVMTEYMGKVMETMQPLQMSVMQKMMQRLNAMPDPAAPAAPN
mgnify:FL=1|jgi:hypothetical protein